MRLLGAARRGTVALWQPAQGSAPRPAAPPCRSPVKARGAAGKPCEQINVARVAGTAEEILVINIRALRVQRTR